MTPAPPANPNSNVQLAALLPKIIYFYMLALFVALVVILVKMFPAAEDLAAWKNPANWLVSNSGQQAQMLYGAGALEFVLGFFVPSLIARRVAAVNTSMGVSPVAKILPAYIVRLCLFEAIALMGFVLAFFQHSPPLIVPFLVLAVFGMALSPPNNSFFEKLAK